MADRMVQPKFIATGARKLKSACPLHVAGALVRSRTRFRRPIPARRASRGRLHQIRPHQVALSVAVVRWTGMEKGFHNLPLRPIHLVQAWGEGMMLGC